MSKRAYITAVGLNDGTPQYTITDKAIGFLIRNSNLSSQSLFIGINEPAQGKIVLAPGESYSESLDRDDYLYKKMNIYFKFEGEGSTNAGFMTVNYATDEEVDCE